MSQNNHTLTSSTNLKLLIFIFLFLPLTFFGQKALIRSGDKLYESNQYYAAIEKYQKALTKLRNNRSERNKISYRLANCFLKTQKYRRANIYFKNLLRYNYQKQHPDILLHLADLAKMNEQWKDAIKYYRQYLKLNPGDKRAISGIATTRQIQNWIEHPLNYKVTDIKKINSRFADFAPAYISGNFQEIIFTSTRKEATGKAIDAWTGTKFSDLFTAQKNREGKWETPKLFDKTETINTKGNEGDPWVNKNFNTLYFTRCLKIPGKSTGCAIYISRRTGRRWSKPQRIRIGGVDTTSSIGQPTLSEDELTIYFSSAKKGTLGGNDLWVAHRSSKNTSFGHAFNLGKVINTKGEEVFPYLRGDTALYFASNGHGGMGGLDIFVSYLDKNGNWQSPKNLKYPLNSPYDDFGIIFHPTAERGFLSSNRKGTRGQEDIFYFIQPPVEFTLSGKVINERTLFGMPGVTVTLKSGNSSVKTITNDKGVYSFTKSQIQRGKDYTVIAEKKNFLRKTVSITTKDMKTGKAFKENFTLSPIPTQPVVLPDILYATGKWELKPQYQDSLQGLVRLLRDNPGLVIELGSHTDIRGSAESNDILSQKRARSVVNYLILRGISPKRLVAKGYGERVPRTLQTTKIKNGITFKKGAVLNAKYINSLTSQKARQAAYALNRRTDFRILRKDFKNTAGNEAVADTSFNINLMASENEIPFYKSPKNGLYIATCFINGYQESFMYDANNSPQISVKKAIALLQEGIINKEDFVGNPEEILQNNTIANHAVLTLKTVTIGGKTIKNIQVIVTKNLFYDFVFGESILKKFGNFRFNTQKHLLIIGS